MATASTAKNGASPESLPSLADPKIPGDRPSTKTHKDADELEEVKQIFVNSSSWKKLSASGSDEQLENWFKSKHHNHHIFHFASQVSKSSWETCQKSAAASGLPAYPPWICAGSDGFRYQKAPKQSQRWSCSQYQSCIELDTQRPKDNSNLLHYRGDVCKAQSHLLSRGYPTPARPSCHCKGHHPQPELQP